MKYLLVMGLVLVVFWVWRNKREAERDAAAPRAPAPPQRETAVTEMVACDVCGVHLPKSEALIGGRGIYCSDAHRRQAGG
ncbi:PP0621 family protein [Polaromonas sp. YR568]|uniref:PP0621 family protein n=1 Tax=Polaromonas sp. YR568 TaxID=1855301 RepID=UPI00398BE0AF